MSEINIRKIRELGKEKGMSLVDIATRAGQTPMAIYRWDTINPRIDKVRSVADVLGVTVDELLNECHMPQHSDSPVIREDPE